MEGSKYLVLSETIFCDVETSIDALNEYYERLKTCLLSIHNVDISNFDYRHFLYISKDKKKFIEKISSFISANKLKYVEIVEYEHPDEGYPWGEGDHIDLIKNPNRTAGYRDRLFEKNKINSSYYKGFMRLAIDDDDAWLSSHIINLLNLGVYLDAFSEKNALVAGGVLNSYIANVLPGRNLYDLDEVLLDRSICGNKFYFSRDWDKIKKWSPWSIPDVIDIDSINKFKFNYNIDLFAAADVAPGLIYFRRGSNLSSQSKLWCVKKTINENKRLSELDILRVNSKASDMSSILGALFGPDEFHDFASGNTEEKSIQYDVSFINFSVNKSISCSFYLYKNGVVLKKKEYSKCLVGSFSINIDKSSDIYEVVCFAKASGIKPMRVKSKKIDLGVTQ